jgi:omega-6 fatty acid desaturase (delta-12 desaturase)
MAVYIGPYLVTNAWLTIVTFLQHTDADVPHYDDTAWTWLKGAFATVDRTYPACVDALQHYIGSTHVIHHLFSDLPHYNTKEAQLYMKQVIGELHRNDPKNLWESLYRTAKLCCVEHKGNGEWYYT